MWFRSSISVKYYQFKIDKKNLRYCRILVTVQNMGIRCWSFRVANQKDVDEVMRLIDDHNTLAESEEGEKMNLGEQIEFSSFLVHKSTGNFYLEAISGGGGDVSDSWIRKIKHKYKIPEILHPWKKPDWYSDETKMDAAEYPWENDPFEKVREQQKKFEQYMEDVRAGKFLKSPSVE